MKQFIVIIMIASLYGCYEECKSPIIQPDEIYYRAAVYGRVTWWTSGFPASFIEVEWWEDSAMLDTSERTENDGYYRVFANLPERPSVTWSTLRFFSNRPGENRERLTQPGLRSPPINTVPVNSDVKRFECRKIDLIVREPELTLPFDELTGTIKRVHGLGLMATTEVFIVTSNNKSYKVIGDLVNELNRLGNDATVEVEGTITGVGTNSPQIIVDHYAIIDLNGNGRPLVGYLTTKDANWVAGSDIPTELVSADFYLSTEKEELPIRTTNQTTLLHLKNIAVQSGIGPKLFIYGLEDGYIKPYRWGVIREITN